MIKKTRNTNPRPIFEDDASIYLVELKTSNNDRLTVIEIHKKEKRMYLAAAAGAMTAEGEGAEDVGNGLAIEIQRLYQVYHLNPGLQTQATILKAARAQKLKIVFA